MFFTAPAAKAKTGLRKKESSAYVLQRIAGRENLPKLVHGPASRQQWGLSRHRATVLVADHSALAEPPPLATVDDDPLSFAGRPAEHRPVGVIDLFRAYPQ